MVKNSGGAGVQNIFPDDVEDFIREHQEGTYLLLDVRQPVEYEQAHLPGAKLIPLPQLADSLSQLDPGRPTIVYCAVGGRSRVAAQLLSHQGFQDVRQLVGGIEGWNQPPAAGPTEFHLQFVRGDETPREMITLGYLFEEGLRKFHQMVLERSEDSELIALLSSLVKAEEGHKRTLLSLIAEQERQQFLADVNAAEGPSVMEGGIDVDQFMAQNEPYLQSVTSYIQLAMMVETQALDLYLRMAQASQQEETRHILYQISNEEKAHLAALGDLMEEKAAASR